MRRRWLECSSKTRQHAMSENIRPLDIDTLVKQYVRLSPAVRYYQFLCLGFGLFPLLLLIVIAFGLGVKLLAVALAWDFDITQSLITALTDKNQFGWLIPRTLPDALRLFARPLLTLFVAISFVALRFNLFAYGAILFLWIDWLLTILIDRIPPSLREILAVHESFRFGPETTPTGDIWAPAGNLWLLGINLWLLWLVVRALTLVRAMSPAEQAIIREGHAHLFNVANFFRAFGTPMNIQNASRRIRTAIFAYLGNLVSWAPLVFCFLAGSFAFTLICIALLVFWNSYPAYPLAVLLLGVIVVLVIMAIILVPFPYLAMLAFRVVGGRSLRASRRYLRVSLEQAQATDPRRPVLFLRSFRDDAVALPPPRSGFPFRLFNYAERNKSLDELLLEEGTSLGPVVALGNPTDAIPPYGAARGYFQNSDWQTMVAQLMEQAIAIVICVDDTESLWWEIEFVVEHRYLGKTLFLLHPKYDSYKGIPEVVRNVEKVLGLAVTDKLSATGRKPIGLWSDRASDFQVGLASYFSRAHYLLMLRWFLRSKMEEEATPSEA
jgi:hypothetical protein